MISRLPFLVLLLVLISPGGPVAAGTDVSPHQASWNRGWPVNLRQVKLSGTIRITRQEQARWQEVRKTGTGAEPVLRWRGRLGPGRLPVSLAHMSGAPSANWLRKPDGSMMDDVLKQSRHRIGKEFMYGAVVTLKRLEKGGINISVSATNKGSMQLAHQYAQRILREEMDRASQDRFLIPLPVFNAMLHPGELVRSSNYYDMEAVSRYYASWVSTAAGDLLQSADAEQVSADLLDFLQSIPYRALDGANGASGLFPPDQLLSRLEGDCDSKSLFWLAAMRHRFPGLPLIFVITHNHAFVGRELQPGEHPSGTILPIGKYRFLLSEPVGPALLTEGVISANSHDALKKGLWHHQVIRD